MSAEFFAWLSWLLFLFSWYGAMLWTSRAVRRVSANTSRAYLLAYAVGFWLLFAVPAKVDPQHVSRLFFIVRPLWWNSPVLNWALVAAELGFFAFAWWARIHLGKLWSGLITLREDHRVVDTGAYRLVRHPIYTGFIGAAWAYAFIHAAPGPFLGAFIVSATMVWKAKAEERFLREELGSEAYDDYAARTPMIVPFVGWK